MPATEAQALLRNGSGKRLNHRKRTSRALRVKHTREEATHPIVSLNASDRLTVLCGHSAVSHIVLQTLVDYALSGHQTVYLDGVHSFEVSLVERLARTRNHRRQPSKALSMIHVARAFSAQQLERLMSHCLVHALERYQARIAVISGLLETVSAGGSTEKEIDRLTNRMIESVRHMTQQGFSLVLPCPSIPRAQTPAHRLFAALRMMSDRCIHIHEVGRNVVVEDTSAHATPLYEGLCEASA